jgi:hypothetical protein
VEPKIAYLYNRGATHPASERTVHTHPLFQPPSSETASQGMLGPMLEEMDINKQDCDLKTQEPEEWVHLQNAYFPMNCLFSSSKDFLVAQSCYCLLDPEFLAQWFHFANLAIASCLLDPEFLARCFHFAILLAACTTHNFLRNVFILRSCYCLLDPEFLARCFCSKQFVGK